MNTFFWNIIFNIGVAAVAGVFLLLGLGMVMGVVILIFEHWFYKYALPSLRLKPKGTIWKSRNIMFFSQKLYRFINCVELVSPHHAARELVHSIRQGQIASLFQKSIKRVRMRFTFGWLFIACYAPIDGIFHFACRLWLMTKIFLEFSLEKKNKQFGKIWYFCWLCGSVFLFFLGFKLYIKLAHKFTQKDICSIN